MLYNFDKGYTDEYLRGLGLEPREVSSKFRIFTDIDLEKLVNEGVVTETPNGHIAVIHGGEQYLAYYYKKRFSFTYGKQPKYHISKCPAVHTHRGYVLSNTKKVSVTCSATGIVHRDLVLKLCGYCRNEILGSPLTTEEFFNKQQEKYWDENEEPIPVDFDGYTLDWPIVSRKYRELKNYRCEECGIDLSATKECSHTHHIDGDKLHNIKDNLKCLCVLCHANQDEHHQRNFKKRRLKRSIVSCVNKYRDELQNVGNRYIEAFLKEQDE